MSDDIQTGPGRAPVSSLKRLWPLAVLLAGFIAFFVLDLDRYLSFGTLRDNRILLREWTAANPWLSVLLYAAVYIAVVSFSLPGSTLMTISGGFLLGPVIGAVTTVFAATSGAVVLFVSAKTVFGEVLHAKAGPAIRKMEAEFRKNELSYMFVLRLVPLFPFFVVNLAPAFLGVSLRNFVIATFFGIIPAACVYTLVGNGLGAVFDAGETPDLGIIFRPEILGPILGLAALAMIPVFYRRFRGARP